MKVNPQQFGFFCWFCGCFVLSHLQTAWNPWSFCCFAQEVLFTGWNWNSCQAILISTWADRSGSRFCRQFIGFSEEERWVQSLHLTILVFQWKPQGAHVNDIVTSGLKDLNRRVLAFIHYNSIMFFPTSTRWGISSHYGHTVVSWEVQSGTWTEEVEKADVKFMSWLLGGRT